MSEFIPTRIAPPTWLSHQVQRDDLLARLDDVLVKRLTLVHAPAGYGKTSLLSQWRDRLDKSAVRTAWLTLEDEDTDAARMAHYLLLSLDGESEHGFVDRPPRAALSALVNRLALEHLPVVLIFDDLDRTEDPAALDFLRALIRLAPANTHFVIASRDYPSLGQSALVAAQQLCELSIDDLKFSPDEAAALLGPQAALDGGTFGRIMARTEGWPIALQLTALSLKRGVDRDTLVEAGGGPSPELARYLSEQVVMALPDDMRQILLRTAVLDRLTGEAVNLLCDRNDGWLVLERLEQQGVAITPLTAERSAFRYHQLFAAYLRERLERQDQALFRAMHRRAAAHFASLGEVSDAVHHALKADDGDLLAEVLEKAGGWRLIPQGMQAMVERGLTALSRSVVDGRWRLRLARIYLSIKRGEMAAARLDYDAFVAETAPDVLSATARIEVRVVGDTLADYENQPMALDDLLEREALLRTLPADDHLVLANFTETLGAKYVEGGWLERALEPTLAAREHYRAMGALYSQFFTEFQEARIRRAQGRISDATAILRASHEAIDAAFGPQSDLAANCAAFESELLFDQDRAAEALVLLDWALPHMERSDGWVDVYNAAYTTAARATAAKGDLEGARRFLERARHLAVRRGLPQLEQLAALCHIELLIDHGDAQMLDATWRELDIGVMADAMREESPRYRPVAIAATLLRAKRALAEDRDDDAGDDLHLLRGWATRHGAGRLLVEVNILLAEVSRRIEDHARAERLFDDAVGAAMFQDLTRPFVDLHRYTHSSVTDALARSGEDDRFRTAFLRGLARVIAARSALPPRPGMLSDGETVILQHLTRGLSNKEIARHIGMSPDTVKYRLKSVFRKIGVHNRRDAVRVSRERGLTA